MILKSWQKVYSMCLLIHSAKIHLLKAKKIANRLRRHFLLINVPDVDIVMASKKTLKTHME